MSAPSLPRLVISHWDLQWPLDAEAAVCVALYLYAAQRARGRWPAARTVAFAAGVGVALVALQSGLDRFDEGLLSAHMAQHTLLLMVAPLLLLTGRPAILALRALPPAGARRLARLLTGLRPLTRPWACLAGFYLVVLGTHLPAFYDATLTTPALHAAEHVAYLLAGALLWWPILDGDPVRSHRTGGLGRLAYMLAAMPPMALVGAYLNRHPSVVYAPYRAAGQALGVAPVADQQQAGALMWVAGGVILAAVGIWAAIASLLAEERRQRALEASAAVSTTGAVAARGGGAAR